jgi:hypothetical protein
MISIKNSISLSDFYFLNPEVNSNCTNLWASKSDGCSVSDAIITYLQAWS